MMTLGISLGILFAETNTNESKWVNEHTIPNHNESKPHTAPQHMNDYEKSPNGHRYFDDPDWPHTDK